MSEQFLYKLKAIRERYGIEKAQQNAITFKHTPQSAQIQPRQHSMHRDRQQRQKQPQLLQFSNKIQKPYESQRSQSTRKMNVNLDWQDHLAQNQMIYDLHKKSFNHSYGQNLYHQPLRAKQCNNETERFSQKMGRQPSNNLNLIYNYDQNPYTFHSKSQFETQPTFHRQPLRSTRHTSNMQNLKFNFDSHPKAQYHHSTFQHQQPTLSLGNQSQLRPDWNIDKLNKVQQKIQAYLLRR